MKTIKKWDTFKETILESNEEETQAQKDANEEMEIKSGDEIKTEEDLKDFFNIDK